MKLDDAYNAWGGHSENRELAQKTKTLFRKMWWLIPTNKPCSYYTLPVLARALQQANGAQSDKVKAASVMVHVLNYAHNVDPEGNNKPDFTFSDILNYEGSKPSPMVQVLSEHEAAANAQQPTPIHQSEAPLVKVKPAAKAKRLVELAKRDGGKAAEKAAKAVVQLDAETLKPVKVWPSCFAAQKELGIKNVQRAIVRHGISGGFYWCRPGDEEGFKPLDRRGKGKNNTKTEKTGKPKKFTDEEKELHRKVFNRATADDGPERQPTDEQQEQLKEAEVAWAEVRRDFEERIANVESILQKCTEDELIAELRRREWHGTLRITRTIEL